MRSTRFALRNRNSHRSDARPEFGKRNKLDAGRLPRPSLLHASAAVSRPTLAGCARRVACNRVQLGSLDREACSRSSRAVHVPRLLPVAHTIGAAKAANWNDRPAAILTSVSGTFTDTRIMTLRGFSGGSLGAGPTSPSSPRAATEATPTAAAIVRPETDALVRSAHDYARAARSAGTRTAYPKHWDLFTAWCAEQGV